MTHPSGEQWTLRHGGWEAVVVEQGGGLRTLTHDGRPVLHGYAASARADGGRGQVLMPWPNRVRGGRYDFAGTRQQLALTEPDRGNANHGLVRWVPWRLQESYDDHLTVGVDLLPQPGYAAALRLRVTYALAEDGLSVTARATNVGQTEAPFGYGQHPYLTCGEDTVDDLELSCPGATVLDVDDQLIPVGRRPVPAGLDFREPRAVGDTVLDHGYTDLEATDGRWEVSVRHAGRRTWLWAEAGTFGYLQLFSGDSLDEPRRTGLAVEPMTCPADAFNSGEALLVLAPGQEWRGTWGVGSEGR